MKTAHIQARLTRISNQINVNLEALKDTYLQKHSVYHRKRLTTRTAMLNRKYKSLELKYQHIL